MNRILVKMATIATSAGLLFCARVAAQVSPTTPKAANVRISEGPEIERVEPDFAIVRWISTNPGGSPEHYGVVHYGAHREDVSQIAKSPIRLNPDHPTTVFRVRISGLKPGTTYYYSVGSMGANGDSDGVNTAVRQFTTPANHQ